MKAEHWKESRELTHMKIGQDGWNLDCVRERSGGYVAYRSSQDSAIEMPFSSC